MKKVPFTTSLQLQLQFATPHANFTDSESVMLFKALMSALCTVDRRFSSLY